MTRPVEDQLEDMFKANDKLMNIVESLFRWNDRLTDRISDLEEQINQLLQANQMIRLQQKTCDPPQLDASDGRA